MEVLAAAGLCATGCGAVVSAFAGGPVLGAFSLAAAVGYGIYSISQKEQFEDAIEGESDEPFTQGIVKVAKQDNKDAPTRASGIEGSASFL